MVKKKIFCFVPQSLSHFTPSAQAVVVVRQQAPLGTLRGGSSSVVPCYRVGLDTSYVCRESMRFADDSQFNVNDGAATRIKISLR